MSLGNITTYHGYMTEKSGETLRDSMCALLLVFLHLGSKRSYSHTAELCPISHLLNALHREPVFEKYPSKFSCAGVIWEVEFRKHCCCFYKPTTWVWDGEVTWERGLERRDCCPQMPEERSLPATWGHRGSRRVGSGGKRHA